MDWKRLLTTTKGRIGRRSFWIFCAVALLAWMIASAIDLWVLGVSPGDMGAASILVDLLLAYPAVCVATKRLHDFGRSGWWQAMPFAASLVTEAMLMAPGSQARPLAPLAGLVLVGGFLLIFALQGFAAGSPGPNRFGEPDSGDRMATPVAEVFS